jgi:hypothetical protein
LGCLRLQTGQARVTETLGVMTLSTSAFAVFPSAQATPTPTNRVWNHMASFQSLNILRPTFDAKQNCVAGYRIANCFKINRGFAQPNGGATAATQATISQPSRFFVSGYGKSMFSPLDEHNTARRIPCDTVPRNARKPDSSGQSPGQSRCVGTVCRPVSASHLPNRSHSSTVGQASSLSASSSPAVTDWKPVLLAQAQNAERLS